MARYMRTDLGSGHTRLRPPVVVGDPIPPPEDAIFAGIRGRLTPAAEPVFRRNQRRAQGFLGGPVVVAAPSSLFYGSTANLAYSRRGVPRWHLRGPVLVTVTPTEVFYTKLNLTPRNAVNRAVRPRPVQGRVYPPALIAIAPLAPA